MLDSACVASVALANGMQLTEVSRRLGHADIRVTAGIYGHLVPSALDKAIEALDAEYAAWMAE